MNPQTPPAEWWVLSATGTDGKAHEVGRFQTDAQAIQFTKDYEIEDFTLKWVSRKSTATI